MAAKPLTTDKLSFAVPTRTVSLGQAIGAGLGAMIGAGIFVGSGIAAGVVDRHLLFALLLATLVVLCSGLNQTQLAAYYRRVSASIDQTFDHADVYGYGQELLNSWLGFAAAWSLALAMAATAATAAIGTAGYGLMLLPLDRVWQIPIALVVVGLAVVWGKRQPSQGVMRIARTIGVLTLLFFTIAGVVSLGAKGGGIGGWSGTLAEQAISGTGSELEAGSLLASLTQGFRAASLLVLAYGGYGQIARLAQTPHPPRWSVWKASGLVLVGVLLLYGGVLMTAVTAIGTTGLSDAVAAYGAPLAVAARSFTWTGSEAIVAVGASLTLLGMVSYLWMELVRVLWVMGQQRDLPKSLARINPAHPFPPFAVIAAGGAIALIILANDLEAIWIFATFSFLLHTAIINLAAYQLLKDDRRYPRWMALLGVALCLFLILWLDWRVWLMGAGLVVVGLVWRGINLWAAEQSDGSG
jgi:basic amino acid/polyamine antiporter, APA family